MERSAQEVIAIIENFVEGTGGARDWDDFISIRIRDPLLESVRIECAELPNKYPATTIGYYCGDEGLSRLHRIAADLRIRRSESNSGLR